MNKIAFALAYMEPEKAFDLYVEHFVNEGPLEKQASLMEKRAKFMKSITDWLSKAWDDPEQRKMLLGLGGAAAGGGLGYMAGGGKGALIGAGLGGLGGYYLAPDMFDYKKVGWDNNPAGSPAGQNWKGVLEDKSNMAAVKTPGAEQARWARQTGHDPRHPGLPLRNAEVTNAVAKWRQAQADGIKYDPYQNTPWALN